MLRLFHLSLAPLGQGDVTWEVAALCHLQLKQSELIPLVLWLCHMAQVTPSTQALVFPLLLSQEVCQVCQVCQQQPRGPCCGAAWGR